MGLFAAILDRIHRWGSPAGARLEVDPGGTRRSPPPLPPPDPERPSDETATLDLDPELELLRELSAGVHAATTRSPLLEEVSGHLMVAAKRAERQDDRVFVASLRQTIRREGISLRTMPQAMVSIQRLLSMPDCDLSALAKTLQLEPAIATRVVAIANSTLYGAGGRAASVEDAVVRIGLRETRNIIMAITCRAKLFRLPGGQEAADRMYAHALASAVAGKLIAGRLEAIGPEEAFIACLLSELGRIVIVAAAADLQRTSRGRVQPEEKAVAKLSGELHGGISALVAESWGFGPETVAAIHHHHNPSFAPPSTRLLSQVMFVADDVAGRVTGSKKHEVLSFSLVSARTAAGIAADFEQVVERARADYQELSRLIEDPGKSRSPARIRGRAM